MIIVKTILALLLLMIAGSTDAGQPARLGAGAWSASDLTRPLNKDEAPQLLEDWRWLIGAANEPVVITAMGDAFVRNGRTGEISFVDTREGKLKPIAPSLDVFHKLLKDDRRFVEEYFSTRLLQAAYARGIKLGAHQVCSFKQPPVLGGPQVVANLEATDLIVHFSVLGQIFHQVHDLPPGTNIGRIELR